MPTREALACRLPRVPRAPITVSHGRMDEGEPEECTDLPRAARRSRVGLTDRSTATTQPLLPQWPRTCGRCDLGTAA
jgi:hypothetical protein